MLLLQAPKVTREQYLTMAIDKLRPLFQDAGHTIPLVRVSIGFPGGGSARKRIGEYWDKKSTSDNIGQIFINPSLDKPFKMLDVLVHELVHACIGAKHGHKGPFRKLAKSVGLTGKMTATVAGPELTDRLNAIIKELPQLDHGNINLSDRKKQKTRMIKVQCEPCNYVCRTVITTLINYGAPICPNCNETMTFEV